MDSYKQNILSLLNVGKYNPMIVYKMVYIMLYFCCTHFKNTKYSHHLYASLYFFIMTILLSI